MKPSKKTPKTRKRRSVRQKLIFLLVLLAAASLAFIWIAQSLFLNRIYLSIKTSELRDACDTMHDAATEEEMLATAQTLSESGFCTAVYRQETPGGPLHVLCNVKAKANCNCLIHRLLSFEEPTGWPPDKGGKNIENMQAERMVRATIAKIRNQGGSTQIDGRSVPDNMLTGDDMTRVFLLEEEDGSTLAFFLNTSVVPLDSTVRTMNRMMLFLSIGVVLLAVVFALMIALWITRPIEQTNRAAKKLAQCDYDVRFEAGGYKEIEELCETLNYAASELAKVDDLQKELIANISHDLRTPLTLISGYAEVMRDLPDENTEENLQIIIDESNRMKELVNDVLDISKIRSGTAVMTFSPLQLTNCVESELTRYNKLRDREGFTIEFRYDALVTVNADYTRLMEVVYNLVNNAVNYAGDDKKIVVTQEVRGDKVRVSVIDTGEGIPEEQLPLIWERYYKVDKTHKRAHVGSGLGLSIVKSIVQAHGGSCGVSSTLGKGSVFWFELDALEVTPLPQ